MPSYQPLQKIFLGQSANQREVFYPCKFSFPRKYPTNGAGCSSSWILDIIGGTLETPEPAGTVEWEDVEPKLTQDIPVCISVYTKGVASTLEVVRPGSRSGLLWVCHKVGVVSFCCRLHVLFYF